MLGIGKLMDDHGTISVGLDNGGSRHFPGAINTSHISGTVACRVTSNPGIQRHFKPNSPVVKGLIRYGSIPGAMSELVKLAIVDYIKITFFIYFSLHFL